MHDIDDGTFWMNYEDFIENFKRIQVCKVDDKSSYSYDEVT